LKSRSSYTWTGEAGKTRAFRILSEPERSLPLAITNVNFSQVRNTDGTRSVSGGSGIGLTYTIVGEADPQVTITISSPLGKIIRRLDGGAPSDATRGTTAGGAQQRSVRWDGRSEDGGSLPLGAYTVTITARGSDGTVARVQRPILMAR
jgi:flagellar hook assembly protein FlgD